MTQGLLAMDGVVSRYSSNKKSKSYECLNYNNSNSLIRKSYKGILLLKNLTEIGDRRGACYSAILKELDRKSGQGF